MKNKHLNNLILSAMFLAVGLVLPFLTGQIQQIGNMLLPMHIPVMLCGFICGWQYGLVVGLIMPVMRSLLFSMPHLYPNAVAMAFELAAYGFVAGLTYKRLKMSGARSIYCSLILSMLLGRAVWGIVMTVIMGMGGKPFAFSAFISGALLNAIPGIILQLILIPIIMLAIKSNKME